MRIESDRHSPAFPLIWRTDFARAASDARPCHGCEVERLITLGCYGALFVLGCGAIRAGDRVLLLGASPSGLGYAPAVAAEVVRSEDGAVAVVFDDELADEKTLRAPFQVQRMLPVCPLERTVAAG